jgi:hypothetical protein
MANSGNSKEPNNFDLQALQITQIQMDTELLGVSISLFVRADPSNSRFPTPSLSEKEGQCPHSAALANFKPDQDIAEPYDYPHSLSSA